MAKLKQEIEGHVIPEGQDKTARRIAELEKRLIELESIVSVPPEWLFADADDQWWHDQLEKLTGGLKSFSDEKAGLLSNGISAQHGWGLKRRLAFARSLRDGFADGEYEQAWSEATPAIRAAYPGLALSPQLGLVPIGPDLESNLWEFAHLQTGEIPERDSDGKLVMKKETGLVFVLLPGGTFQMGAQKNDPTGANYDPKAQIDEGPVREVTLSSFFLSKFEMTQGQWQRIAGRNPSSDHPETDSRWWSYGGRPGDLLNPVEQVSWNDCESLCERLGLELPSEAQWEYGARGGTSTVWWTGNEKASLQVAGNVADRYAKEHGGESWAVWEEWDDGTTTHARVGMYIANPFGLHDVIGNVWEWCRDEYGAFRVSRGGSMIDAAVYARSACLRFTASANAEANLGLRPARKIAP